MEDFEDIQEIFKMKKMSNIKFIINIIGLLGALGGGWYKLESRVSALETQMEQEDKVKSIQAEIELMKRDQELEELRFKWKLDSLQRS
tara:strand:+ start:402 stop:665 length:264 start_codon:yes stop_codon:yes gene_type:complete